MTDNIHSGGMHARPVVGGFFIKMLSDRAIWKKWASRDKLKPANWAPLPTPPQDQHARAHRANLALHDGQAGRELERRPTSTRRAGRKAGPGSARIRRDSSSTRSGPPTTSGSAARSPFPRASIRNLQFVAYHDEDVEIYVNGILAAEESGFTTSYVPLEISRRSRAVLKPGAKILVAVHCHQTAGGQGIDVGLADVTEE